MSTIPRFRRCRIWPLSSGSWGIRSRHDAGTSSSRLGNGPGRRIQRRRDAHAPECQGAARIGSRLVSDSILVHAGDNPLATRAAEDGLRVIAEAKNLFARDDEHMWETELKRVEGELGHVQGTSVFEIETCFEQALQVARCQSAKSFELRAAMSLARLWRDQRKVQQARELLAPVYGWFTEGFDT
jgi:hypothetical protein